MIDGHVCVDGAYKVALSTGKTPKLCAKGSSFMLAYNSCVKCISENSEDGEIQSYVEPKFGQFINYCEGEDTSNPQSPQSSATTDCDACITTALEDYRGSTIMIVLGTKTVPTSSLLDSKLHELLCVAWARVNSLTRVGLQVCNSQADGYVSRNWTNIVDCRFRDRSQRYVYHIIHSQHVLTCFQSQTVHLVLTLPPSLALSSPRSYFSSSSHSSAFDGIRREKG